jgi:hypothetical protein
MPIKPTIRDYGSSFGVFGGRSLTDYTVSSGNIDTEKLNVNYMEDGVEFNRFEESIKDFILARLGSPIVRVELSPFQIKTAIDEAITLLSHHAPLWTRQLAAFQATAGENLYELPLFIMHNLSYVVYKKTLLTIASQSGTLEFDFFIKYFQDNHLFSDFSVGEFLLLQQHLEQLRKILSQEGTWDILDNRYLQVYPTPVTNGQTIIVEYRALNSDTIHPAYRNWIQRYSLACSKEILGQIRGKYKTLASPGGGAQLNGEELIQQSVLEKEDLYTKLLEEIEEPPVFTMF